MKSSRNRLKRYPFTESPFFRLKGKGQLERLLNVGPGEVSSLAQTGSYRVWLNDKGREIQAPIGRLAVVHKRIARLLERISVPDYVYSQRGRSHIENAAQHIGNTPLVKTDINKFYPSTTHGMVKRVFLEDLQCAGDIAQALADMCCYQQRHLPTGSTLSGYLAFLAARPLLDRINTLAVQSACKMTNLVDDITISGPAADRSLLVRVRRMIRNGGLKTRNGKSKVYTANRPKPITGAIVVGEELRLPNRQHLKIKRTRLALLTAAAVDRPALEARLKGQLVAANQVLDRS